MAKLESILIERVDNGLVVTIKEGATRSSPKGLASFVATTHKEVMSLVSQRLIAAGFQRYDK